MKMDVNIIYKLFNIKDKKEQLKREEKEIQEMITEFLKKNSLDKYTTKLDRKNICFEIIPEKTETTFDSTRFKKEQPDLTVKYLKEKTTKEKLKIKIEEE